MDIPQGELFAVLQQFNPWWSELPIRDLPEWERSAFVEIYHWVEGRDRSRSLMLTGARQTGKTTLYRQAIRRLVQDGHPPQNILYATFDHPLFKLAGLEQVVRAWEALYQPIAGRPRFLFIDEIQYVEDWQTWLKHQVDFQRQNRIAVTGSAFPLRGAGAESGVGRWETIPLATLSFSEYLRLHQIPIPRIPQQAGLGALFDWTEGEFLRVAHIAQQLTVHFHDYLIRSGFPEPSLVEDITRCQRLLREDIVEKVLKRDMTALYGVRRVLEVERLFLYLCYHDGGILDLATITKEMNGISRPTAQNFLDLFESTHLIYRLKPWGWGKEILKGRDKVYLADAALPGAMMLLGRRLFEQPERLGAAVETVFFKHVLTRFYPETPSFFYWRDRKDQDHEVDLIADLGGRLMPFEVKYRGSAIKASDLKGIRLFMEQHKIAQGYVITQRWEDFKVATYPPLLADPEGPAAPIRLLMIPAPLACYWLSD